jgi:hypothetical protein
MGIGDWLRRLLGRDDDGMPCALCHCAIPRADFEKGRAVILARQPYCRGCVEEVTRRSAGRPPWASSPIDLGSSSTVLLR